MSEQIASAIRYAQEQFEPISDSARLDAELLLAHCLQKPRSYLYSWPEKMLEETIWQAFQSLVDLRLKPTPLAYLLVSREFYSLDFKISPVALIPRPETELLVETTLALCAEIEKPRILEMGTGTGIISIVLCKERPDIDIVTTDISKECLELAESNARLHGVTLNCIQSDWYAQLPEQACFDLIVSNPPYIRADDPYLNQGDLPAEPLLALTPGPTGLEAIQQITEGARLHLRSGGYLLVEHGFDQAEAVSSLLEAAGFSKIRNILDHSGHPRISLGQLP
jgi:release factor glutamine methyltransferase